MAVYKQVRKAWLKLLTKDQKKLFKGYVQNVADDMLDAYVKAIRLGKNASKNVSRYIPIPEGGVDMHIHIQLDKWS